MGNEMVLNKQIKYFAAKDHKTEEETKKTRSPRKQQKSKKSLAGLRERKAEKMKSWRPHRTIKCLSRKITGRNGAQQKLEEPST